MINDDLQPVQIQRLIFVSWDLKIFRSSTKSIAWTGEWIWLICPSSARGTQVFKCASLA